MSKKVRIGDVVIGGGEKIAVQSMSTLKISDTLNAIEQAKTLAGAGCDVLRFSVLDEADALSFSAVKNAVKIPLVADIHFDYRLALKSIDGGADKIRINPGNVGGEQNVKEIAVALKRNGIPVRVGSNTGSVEKEFLRKYGKNEVSLAESALKNVALLEKYGVENIVVSVKASDVPLTVKAYEYVAARTSYPLHLGVTEAGTEYSGVVKNAVGIGSLLLKGIGDTIRVSLSADPIREVVAAKELLSAVGKGGPRPVLIACPTCGRCSWDCMSFAKKTEEFLKEVTAPIRVAVMGCVVNGPGEAADCDLGVCGGADGCLIFKKGEIFKKVKKEDVEKEFFDEIKRCLK